jgi:hypothetical protein
LVLFHSVELKLIKVFDTDLVEFKDGVRYWSDDL